MNIFDLREPVSALTHASWLALSVPGALLLWQRSRGNRARQFSLMVFVLCLMFCYGSSALYHAVRLHPDVIERFNRMDHASIYLLIAGSYTPVVWNVLRGRLKWAILATVWAVGVAGALRVTLLGVLPPLTTTALYLAMGWGAIFCYVEVIRATSPRAGLPLLLGGVLYSVGALLNVLHWPVLWTGVVGAHEVFHVFVMAGSLAHFWFMLDCVTTFTPEPIARRRVHVLMSHAVPNSARNLRTDPDRATIL